MWPESPLNLLPPNHDFYSHIPCGMWPEWFHVLFLLLHFYSHIPCGMWRGVEHEEKWFNGFLLTHPVWDVTMSMFLPDCKHYISTHTSRVGCDAYRLIVVVLTYYFYSHIPCGMWRHTSTSYLDKLPFLLTHPVWDVTKSLKSFNFSVEFLLTHPVWDVTERPVQ